MFEISTDLQMWAVLVLVVLSIGAFAWERVPIEVTATVLLTGLMVFFQLFPVPDAEGANRLGPDRLLAGFANPGLITVLALLVVGQAIVRTGALEGLASALHRASRGSAARGTVFSLLPAAAISSILNNTPVVVIFIPIVSAFAERLRISVSRLLIPLSFASILGGMTTLIGSSTNLLVAGVAIGMGLPVIGFFDFLIPGLVMAGVGLVYVILVAPFLLADRSGLAKQLGASSRQFVAQIDVQPDSELVGQKPVAGMFRSLPDMTVRMIQRGEHAILPPFDDVALHAGDVIIVAATRKALTEALSRLGSALHPGLPHRDYQVRQAEDSEDSKETDDPLDQMLRGPQVLAEVMVSPASRMIGRSLEMIGFRYLYQCVVLGVQRRSSMIRQRMTEIRLEPGDVLLIQGHPSKVKALRDNRDLVLLEWSQANLPSYRQARRAGLIFAAVVLLAAAGVLPIVVAAILGAAAMIVTRCINIRQASRTIDRQVVMTVAATLALGAAMQETGGAAFLAHNLLDVLHGAAPAVVVSALFLFVALITNVLSNNASAVLFTPVAISVARELNVDPMILVYTMVFAASCSFATPVGYQTNLLVMAPGHYRFIDFMKAGTPLIFILWITFSLFGSWYYGLAFNSNPAVP